MSEILVHINHQNDAKDLLFPEFNVDILAIFFEPKSIKIFDFTWKFCCFRSNLEVGAPVWKAFEEGKSYIHTCGPIMTITKPLTKGGKCCQQVQQVWIFTLPLLLSMLLFLGGSQLFGSSRLWIMKWTRCMNYIIEPEQSTLISFFFFFCTLP